jgi:ketosteroid isomerase-like protein
MTTLDGAALAERFYTAFARRDWRTMAASYHTDAHFTDEVFDLHGGAEIGRMWRMLCERGADLRIEHGDVVADADGVRARWQAWYTFGATGRPVHNLIDATMTLHEGLILRHVDHFDFWRWSRQALGLPGLLLGWSPRLRSRVREQAARGLAGYRPRD